MSATLAGGCLCGQIRYECDEEPRYAYICHCRDCQRAHGSAYCPGLMFRRDAVRIVQGSPKDFTRRADSGSHITRQFCPDCGSPLFTRLEHLPGIVIVKAGTLDDPRDFKPEHHIWARSEMPWAHVQDGVERLPEGHTPGQITNDPNRWRTR